jgi:hypothetical protein
MTADLDATCGHESCSKRGTYRMAGACSNCAWTGKVVYTKGHKADPAVCPGCGCREVRPTWNRRAKL